MNRITKGAPSRMLKDCPDVLNIDEMCAVPGVCTRIGDRLQRDGSIVSRKVGANAASPSASAGVSEDEQFCRSRL